MECRKAVSLFENGFPMREISEICNVPQKEIESFLKKHYQLQRYFASSTHRQDEEHESARASSKSDIVEKINRAKDLYETHYSICKVAEIMNITRERVRQLLVEGERLGLCRDIPIKDRKIKLLRRYSKKDIIASIQRNITQEKVCRELRITPQSSFFLMSQYGIVWKMINKGRLIASIQRNYSKKKVCKELRIVPQSLNYLINFYGIDWRLIQGGIRKGKCLGKYYRIVKKLKRHPHSDELIGKPGSLYSSIIRNWGSLAAFRKINKIKKPPPRYNHCRPILRKVKKINRVKDIVLKHGLVDMSTIARISKIKQQSLYQYLTLLRKLGFIGFTGSRQKRKYKIIKKNDVSLGELFPQ
ncbi:hypothetical protein HY768_06220 [candidate division TA06 bacterium]|uniref:Uncharacterized protein n=1 Tax=candidate division TA06 bacterium TaxID=2250710 RepID=A0A933ICG0_UNCT6|nr:hypothetical protein [candidate division TA06 bacterium]